MTSQLSCQPCSYVLASKDRQLVFNGPVKLLDKKNPRPRDVVAFLFTDSLLLTQQKSTQVDKRNVKKEVVLQYALCAWCVLAAPAYGVMIAWYSGLILLPPYKAWMCCPIMFHEL